MKKQLVVSGLRLVLGIGFLGLLSGCACVANKASTEKGLLPAPMRAETGTEASPVAVPEAPAPNDTTAPDKLHVSEIPCLWPVDEDDHVILSSFGYRGGRHGCFHRAVDIRASMNAPVLASASGTVKKASAGGNYGKLVVLDHGNGYESLYAHLNEIDVEPGQKVACGEQIGLAGQTGNATCPHVHYEILRQEEAVNPVEFLPMGGVHIEQFASLAPPKSSKLSKVVASSKSSQKDPKASKTAKKSGKTVLAKKSSKEAPSQGKAAKQVVADTDDAKAEPKSASKTKPTKTASVDKKTPAAMPEKATKAAKAASTKDSSAKKETSTKATGTKRATATKAAKAEPTKTAAKTAGAKGASPDKPKVAAKASGNKKTVAPKTATSKKSKS